jgi:hypothetical protein
MYACICWGEGGGAERKYYDKLDSKRNCPSSKKGASIGPTLDEIQERGDVYVSTSITKAPVHVMQMDTQHHSLNM